jgi:hypothetical protein
MRMNLLGLYLEVTLNFHNSRWCSSLGVRVAEESVGDLHSFGTHAVRDDLYYDI